MYKAKEKKFAIIALAYYLVMVLGYLMMGILYKEGVKEYVLIHWLLVALAVFIVFSSRRRARTIRFWKGKAKNKYLDCSLDCTFCDGICISIQCSSFL